VNRSTARPATDEQELISGKRGPTWLGFALLLKFDTRVGRFPRGRGEVLVGYDDLVGEGTRVANRIRGLLTPDPPGARTGSGPEGASSPPAAVQSGTARQLPMSA
jgi:hypothetical protein